MRWLSIAATSRRRCCSATRSPGLKDVEGAIEEIQEAIKLDPGHALGYVSLGALEHAAGRHPDAEAAFRKAIDADPKSIPAYLGLANFYWASGKTDDAARTLEKAYEIDPDHALTNRMLALFQIAAGRPADAEQYLANLARLSKDANAQLVLADYYLASGRTDKAVPLLAEDGLDTGTRRGRLAAGGARLRARAGGRRRDKRLDALLEREPANAAGAGAAGAAPGRRWQAR